MACSIITHKEDELTVECLRVEENKVYSTEKAKDVNDVRLRINICTIKVILEYKLSAVNDVYLCTIEDVTKQLCTALLS